jgi:hypothetical protein
MITLHGEPVYGFAQSNSTTLTLAMSWNIGDLVLVAYTNGTGAISGITNTGSGLGSWALIEGSNSVSAKQVITADGVTFECEVWYSIATGSGSGTVTITRSAPSGFLYWLGIGLCLSDVSNSTPFDVIGDFTSVVGVPQGDDDYAEIMSVAPLTQALLINAMSGDIQAFPVAPLGYSLIASNRQGTAGDDVGFTGNLSVSLQGITNTKGTLVMPPPDGGWGVNFVITFTILLQLDPAPITGGGSGCPGCRQCVRLSQPSPKTVETISVGNLAIYIGMPFDLVNQYVAQIPNVGPDTLTVNYTDNLGQSGSFTRNVTFWMSDYGYVFLSVDQGTQFLVASNNECFWETNTANVNGRNVTAGATALLACCNQDRYDANTLQPNQQIPPLWIYNGVELAPTSSSSSG